MRFGIATLAEKALPPARRVREGRRRDVRKQVSATGAPGLEVRVGGCLYFVMPDFVVGALELNRLDEPHFDVVR